jgi:hypothetical protein
MTQLISKKRSLVLTAALVVMVAPGVVYARNGVAEEATSPSSSTGSTAQTEQSDNVREPVKDKVQAIKEEAKGRVVAAKARLQDAQLKRCQAHEKAITNIMTRIADRGQKQLDLFTTIATRAENFYTEKGHTLSSYDSLVADVNAKKETAQTVVNDTKTADITFACDGDNPHGVIDGFKDSLKQEIAALKEYRTAVKNLIVGVKSVQSTEAQPSSSEGAKE